MTTKFISDMGPKSALIAPRPFIKKKENNNNVWPKSIKIEKIITAILFYSMFYTIVFKFKPQHWKVYCEA